MKILLAPAKQMKYRRCSITTTPVFQKQQQQLHTVLKRQDINSLHDIMKISFAMAAEVYGFYHQKEDYHPALHYYSGTVYQQLKLATYTASEQNYIHNYVRIASAYYGVLAPYDTIQRYRLDMKMKFENISLYAYWKSDIERYFQKEDMIISLASKEFTTMVTHPQIITIDFVEDRGGKLVRNAVQIKKARGKMLHHMIKNKITSIEDIQNICFDNYQYRPSLSTKNNLVFYRQPDRSY